MIDLHRSEFVREGQNVEAERRCDDPLGDRTGHVVLPAPVRGIPLTRIGSVEQDVRYDAGDGHDDEEDGAQHRNRQAHVGLQHGSDVRLKVVRDVGLKMTKKSLKIRAVPTIIDIIGSNLASRYPILSQMDSNGYSRGE